MRSVRFVLAATCAATLLLGFSGRAGAGILGPVANPDTASTTMNASVDINVLANDDIPDEFDLFPPGVAILIAPSHGTAVVTAGFHVDYAPAEGFTGVDTFEYLLCTIPPQKVAGSPQPQCPFTSKAEVTVTVTGPPPTTTTDPATTTSLEPLAVTTTVAPAAAATTSVAAAAAANTLPQTGSGSTPLGVVGIVSVAAGGAALLASKRARRRSA